jgi:hypothetical protein
MASERRGLVVTGDINAADARDLLLKCCAGIDDAHASPPQNAPSP